MRLFDGYVAVDWSASATPELGAKSIWIAACGVRGTPELKNPCTRQEAMKYIVMLLEKATEKSRRLLCGFDFPFGYPEGTASILTGQSDWAALWERIADVIEDGRDNNNNRFIAAAELNEAFEGEGPFWGRPRGPDIPGLTAHRPQHGWEGNLPPRLRYAELQIRRAQEVWKLYGNGSVGSQALTGIARLQRIRRRTGAQVWPFETLGGGRSHMLAEIYPSLIGSFPGDEVEDARQVTAVATTLRQLDMIGELRQHLRAPLVMPARVRHEEGVILGMHDREGFEAAARRTTPYC